jgi:hypothetical protein
MDSARHTEKLMGLNQDSTSLSVAPEVPHVALTCPPLSRFALYFARLNGYLDLGFLVRMAHGPDWTSPEPARNTKSKVRSELGNGTIHLPTATAASSRHELGHIARLAQTLT